MGMPVNADGGFVGVDLQRNSMMSSRNFTENVNHHVTSACQTNALTTEDRFGMVRAYVLPLIMKPVRVRRRV